MRDADRTTSKRAVRLGSNGDTPTVSHDVPLPGYQTGRRFVRVDLPLSPADWLPKALNAGEDLVHAIKLKKKDGGSGSTFDPVAAAELFRRKLYESGATPAE